MPEPGTWIYALNLVLGGVAFTWMVYAYARRRSELPDSVRRLHENSMALLGALLVVSAQRLYYGEGVLPDAIVVSLAKTLVLVNIWRIRKTLYRTGRRHPGNGDSDDRNRDIVA